MKITDEHLYHGAVLNQIAEHPKFTAINAFKIKKVNSRSTFRVNDDVAVYLKYASEPIEPWGEYLFSFKEEHLDELRAVSKKVEKTFVALVCVDDREVCCLTADEVFELVEKRQTARGQDESVYGILVTAKKNSKLRAYVNVPNRRGRALGELRISRNAFPGCLFE